MYVKLDRKTGNFSDTAIKLVNITHRHLVELELFSR
jgi:hypothetical protein